MLCVRMKSNLVSTSMIGLIQRVTSAKVEVKAQTVGRIDSGLTLFLGIEKEDSISNVDRLTRKVLGYRVFPDDAGKMNLSLTDTQGGLLIVSQFTLVADTQKGLRASFTSAASPMDAKEIYDAFVRKARSLHPMIAAGIFGADMQITLCNDGPVTFILYG